MQSKSNRTSSVERKLLPALLHLLETKELKDISITEICKEAGVSRISFYRNFSSKEDILVSHMEKNLIAWRKMNALVTPEKATIHFYEEMLKEKEILRSIYNHHLWYLVSDLSQDFFGNQESSVESIRYKSAGLSGTVYGMMTQWVRDGMRKSPTAMLNMTKVYIDYMEKLFTHQTSEENFLNPFPEEEND